MGVLRRILDGLDDRLGVSEKVAPLARHKVPPGSARGKSAWMYVFGVATLTAFVIQLVSGVALATKYIPSPDHAYASLRFITEEAAWGALLRGIHFYGASAMVLLVVVHMSRVFLTGSYKFPRELNWLTGVALLVLVGGMAITGQLLRWDQDGVWTVVVGAQFAARFPFIGPELAEFILAGPTLGGRTLSRFYAFHVFILPGLIIGLIGVHLYLIEHHGISEPPEAGRPVEKSTYRDWYQELLDREGRPHWPDAAWREVVAGFAVIVVVIVLALVFGPKGPGAPPDPTNVRADPRPDWFLTWYYALVAVKPRGLETLFMVYLPLAAGALLAVLPFVAPSGERSPTRRPWAVGVVVAAAIAFGTLTYIGFRAPWVPRFETRPLPPERIGAAEGPVFEGAQIFHARGCQYCHRVAGRGGVYGPDLTDVLNRMSPEEATVRIINGFGDMPAYANVLSQGELEAILALLRALALPPGDRPAAPERPEHGDRP